MEYEEFDPSSGKEEHFSFESTATSIRIPRENWDHPAVKEFVQFVARLENLQADLSIAHSRTMPKWETEGEWAMKTQGGELAQYRDLLGAPDMVLPPSSRYAAAELLLRATMHIMKKDIGEPAAADFKGYLKSKINAALAPQGLEVVEKQKRG